MSSLEKVSPGIRPRFFSQKMEQKEPEKKMPSTQAKATSRSAKRSALRGTGRARVGGSRDEVRPAMAVLLGWPAAAHASMEPLRPQGRQACARRGGEA